MQVSVKNKTKQTPTLEQQRAQNAWQVSAKYRKEEVIVAKSLPALIMNSGLMQVMAFAQEKKKQHSQVAEDLRQWLASRFPDTLSDDFNGFMQALMQSTPQQYQAINSEALAWLKWLRHMATARAPERGHE